MKIQPNEVERIEDCGMLNDSPCKLIKTIGGFWIIVGKKRKHSQDEALAAGSHPAIVKYNMEKNFSNYQPSMMKSEGFIEPIVEKHSHFLSEDLRKSGHDIFSIQSGPSVEFQITKHNSKIASVNGSLDSDSLLLLDLNIPKQFAGSMAGATLEKSISCKVGLKLKK